MKLFFSLNFKIFGFSKAFKDLHFDNEILAVLIHIVQVKNSTTLSMSLKRVTKGQLISKCSFGVIVWTKIPTNFLRSSALASKKRLNKKKIKTLFFFNYLKIIGLGTYLI